MPEAPRRPPGSWVLTGPDLLAGGLLVVVALLAWSSLVLADVGRHTLPGVAALTLCAVALLVHVCRPATARVRVRADPAGLAVALVCAAVVGALTFPSFSYDVADKDPGGYVSHAVEIARTGSYRFTDPALASHLPVQLITPGARFPGVWVPDPKSPVIVPQFYHLWPALLATAYEAGGMAGLRDAVPVAGVLAVLCMVALLRRVGGALAGSTAGLAASAAGGLLLATNMLEVWQNRFPTTEVFAQALYLGSLLGVVVALRSGWRPAAGLAGLLLGIGWLNRADGVLTVLIAVGVGAALLAVRRFDGRAAWFAGGLAVVTPHALLQAYHLALTYTQKNGVPPLAALLALMGGLAAVAVALRLAGRALTRWVVSVAEGLRGQRVTGLVLCALAFGLLVLGFLRPVLFGADFFDYNNVHVRSYDEAIMRRLSWFLTLPGMALMGLGVAVVALRRWRAVVWAAVLPTLVLFPVYAYSARNSTRLLWWTRRYVPTVLPGFVILVALTLGFAFVWRLRGRAVLRLPALVALVALVAAFLGQSLPLRHHDEWAGSGQVSAELAALSGHARGVYFWDPAEPCCLGPMSLFATPLWLQEDELSVLLPQIPQLRDGWIRDYHRGFPGAPIFLVASKGVLPPGVSPSTVRLVRRIRASFPMWDESDFHRPSRAHRQPTDMGVWRVVGT